MATVGLDFGTSNTAVALSTGEVLRIDAKAERAQLLRSVLFYPEDSKEELVGHEAIERYQADPLGRFIQSVKTWLPARSFTKTQLRGKTLALEQLIAVFLSRVRALASEQLGQDVSAVVLGRPARFSEDAEVDAFAEGRLLRAAELAGFTSVQLLIEPIAAALAYEATLSRDEVVLVADFGAGTSDLTLMRLGPGHRGRGDRRADVIASAGVYVGGDRFDAAIMKHALLQHFGEGSTYEVGYGSARMPMPTYVLNRLQSWNEMSLIREKKTRELLDLMLKSSDRKPAIQALEDLVMENLGFRLYRAIERAKVQLSTRDEATIDFEEARISIHERITRKEFERASRHLIDELEACADGLMKKLPAGVTLDAVFLTGGSSQVPAVRQLFANKFGEAKLRSADAFSSVVEGLGRAADASFTLSGERS